MNHSWIRTALIVIAGASVSTFAQAQSSAGRMSPGKMTCTDYVALDDTYKPYVLYWAMGVNRMGIAKTEEIAFDTARPVAEAVTQSCKSTPKTKIVDKVKSLAQQGNLPIFAHH